MIHYGMTKTAQLAVARGLAETLAGTGVTVNSILPGPTASEGVSGFVSQLAAERGLDIAAMTCRWVLCRPTGIFFYLRILFKQQFDESTRGAG
jgi:NAD(P)-dependent dehydrogenase (short-subunit alcohol dehydrogenase family)